MTDVAPLRFGIMCNGLTFRAWQAACLRELLALPGVEARLLIVDAEAELADTRGFGRRLLDAVAGRSALWNLYNRLFVRRHSEALRPVDLAETLSQVPIIRCRVDRRGQYSQYFSEQDIKQIRRYDLDFIIRFAFNIIRGTILQVPRCGVWSYHHADLDKYRGYPAGFWEIYLGDPVTGVTLQRLNDRIDGGVVLHKGYFKTIEKSYTRNRDLILLGSVNFVARVCKDIRVGAASYLHGEPSKTTAPLFRAPTNAQTLLFVGKLLLNRLADMFGWLFRHEQWGVGIIDRPIHSFLSDEPLPHVRWLPKCPRNRFLADPFGCRRDQVTTLLVEDYDHRRAKAFISAVAWRDGEQPPAPRKVLETSVHLSYPYVLEEASDIYCIPEAADAGEVYLFKAETFPDKWVKVSTLIRGIAALDPTVFQHEGRWWLFYATKIDDSSLELCAWHAPALRGSWTPHACNPLKTDIRSSRPAGTPFRYAGHLYRPAQDCSRTYGGGVVINQILRLTPTEFEEKVVREIRPGVQDPYPAGLHTLSAAGTVTLIDGKRKLFVPVLFWRELASVIRRLTVRRSSRATKAAGRGGLWHAVLKAPE